MQMPRSFGVNSVLDAESPFCSAKPGGVVDAVVLVHECQSHECQSPAQKRGRCAETNAHCVRTIIE